MALRKVDAVGQYHSNMRSSTALSQSHDTTRGVGCPILATQPSPPTQSPKNTQCSACPPMGPQRGAPWHSERWMLWASIIATCGLLRHSHSDTCPHLVTTRRHTSLRPTQPHAGPGPAVGTSRAFCSHGAPDSSTDQTETLEHKRLNHVGPPCPAVARAPVREDCFVGRGSGQVSGHKIPQNLDFCVPQSLHYHATPHRP